MWGPRPFCVRSATEGELAAGGLRRRATRREHVRPERQGPRGDSAQRYRSRLSKKDSAIEGW